jgi:hypothetical protein
VTWGCNLWHCYNHYRYRPLGIYQAWGGPSRDQGNHANRWRDCVHASQRPISTVVVTPVLASGPRFRPPGTYDHYRQACLDPAQACLDPAQAISADSALLGQTWPSPQPRPLSHIEPRLRGPPHQLNPCRGSSIGRACGSYDSER